MDKRNPGETAPQNSEGADAVIPLLRICFKEIIDHSMYTHTHIIYSYKKISLERYIYQNLNSGFLWEVWDYE